MSDHPPLCELISEKCCSHVLMFLASVVTVVNNAMRFLLEHCERLGSIVGI